MFKTLLETAKDSGGGDDDDSGGGGSVEDIVKGRARDLLETTPKAKKTCTRSRSVVLVAWMFR